MCPLSSVFLNFLRERLCKGVLCPLLPQFFPLLCQRSHNGTLNKRGMWMGSVTMQSHFEELVTEKASNLHYYFERVCIVPLMGILTSSTENSGGGNSALIEQ
ncbi:hypothetical protein KIL84_011941 [Mauremys mutica]|uniref:Uncharacterized protein n=1 Tax=Mauremys mutica TaxID=74926 RepID=A0A9D3XAM1_9SAUR|nr:hypothetical protein KIL84_011941 [Mauremys mutica]